MGVAELADSELCSTVFASVKVLSATLRDDENSFDVAVNDFPNGLLVILTV